MGAVYARCPLCSSYGAIRKVRMVLDSKTKKPRGYAFIEFERERDTRNAYKQVGAAPRPGG